MVFHGVRRIPRRKEVHIQIAIAGNCGATAFFFFFFTHDNNKQYRPGTPAHQADYSILKCAYISFSIITEP